VQVDEMGYVMTVPRLIGWFKEGVQRRVKQVALGEAHTIVLDE
jgi:hypothetical protein